MEKYELRPELEKFPISRLNVSTRLKLSELLDDTKISCTKDNLPRDYRGLAQLAGLDALTIMLLEKEQKPMEQVLFLWCERAPDSTVRNLVDYLEELDCYYVIDEVIPMLERTVCEDSNVSSGHNISSETVSASSDQSSLTDDIEILPRQSWNSVSVELNQSLPATVGLVFLFHTGRAEDVNEPHDIIMRRLQEENMSLRGYTDTYNFAVSPKGKIVEGMGWFVGDSPARYNHMAVSVVLIGDYNTQHPDQRMLDGMQRLMQNFVRKGKLEPHFGLYGACDVTQSSHPGNHIMQAIASWPSFRRKGDLQEDWQALSSIL